MSFSISSIIERIDENQIFVPAFQREYVWNKDNAKELIDSLIKDYPFGTMLSWDTNSPPKLKGNHKYNSTQGAIKIILDGQQRITTLYLLITGKVPPYYKEDEIKHNVRDLYVHLLDLELSYFKRTIMENSPFWVNITDIFKKEIDLFVILEKYREQNGNDLERDKQRLINENIRKIENIPDKIFPEQVIPVKATTNEAIDIFYKVNDGGIKLTDAELALAQISGYWPEARDLFKAKLNELSKDGFKLELDHVIYAVLGCMYYIGSDMKKLHSETNLVRIKEVWGQLDKRILDYVFNILKSRAFVDHRKEINSIYAIIPLIVFSFKNENIWTETEIKKAIKWFYYSQIRKRYVNQLQQKLDYDLRIIKNNPQPFDELLSVIENENRLKILPEEFERVNILHPLWSMMKFYFKSQNAICFTTGLSIRKNMGRQYELEWDHIFPKSKLKENGYSIENYSKYQLAQEITNRSILTKIANRKKSDQPAKNHLMIVKKNFPEALKLQVIPDNENLWDLNNFENFLITRREMLATSINNFLNNITDNDPIIERNAINIEDIIFNGENQAVEFKKSIRWDFNKEENDKAREDDIIKCIAAFGNSEDGGTLFIGVSDDQEIIGLEADYKCLTKKKNGNKDTFENHLREVTTREFGVVFSSQKINVSFPNVNNYEICMVDVEPISKASDLLFVSKKDTNGQTKKILYLRSGNSSRIIPQEEMEAFIRERF